jgi:hypothetical protein
MIKLLPNKTAASRFSWKKQFPLFLALAVSALIICTCSSSLGFGDRVDFEPPILEVLAVQLQNGEEKLITDGTDKLFIGPGILFGKGAVLKGRATDNIGVVHIRVVEPETGQVWTSSNIGAPDEDNWQEWSISLEGLQKGERNVEVTALDRYSNIGADTVKQLALLVDTDPPIVESIKIERDTVSTPIYADLLPLTLIKTLDIDNFDHVDYFQNESFKIHAAVSHEFILSNVTLNFLDAETEELLFDTPRQRNTGTTIYNPSWDIKAKDFTDVNPAYATGPHYFKAVITAKAEAGHTNDIIINELYNLCWWPESDKPRIKATDTEIVDGKETIYREMGSTFPLQVFDDDKINEVYWAIVTDDWWENSFSTANGATGAVTDAQKMQWIESHRTSFKDDLGSTPTTGTTPATMTTNQLTSTGVAPRNVMVPIQARNKRDTFRLIVLAQENKKAPTSPVMSSKLYTLITTGDDDDTCKLVNIVCLTPPGAYTAGTELKFKLIFDTKMKIDVGKKVSITIGGGINGNIGGSIVIDNFAPETGTENIALLGSWTVPTANTNRIVFDPVQIEAVDISNATNAGYDTKPPPASSTLIGNYNTSRTGLKVMNIPPYVTRVNGDAVSSTDAFTVLAPLTPIGGKSVLRLEFSHPVWPENGTITVKPADGWRIPPVLSNDDFAKINNALTSAADRTALTNSAAASYYIKNTHGLKKNNDVYTGAPDIDTKYVLNFSSSLNNALLRPILEKAEYNWQKIEVTEVGGKGTRDITVTLDQLPDGRLWKVEIIGPNGTTSGAFRDEAGNIFAGWGATPARAFWSAKTAEPVIRVNRVSNNTWNIAPSSNRVEGTKGTSSEVTSRIDVQYRIDSETPNAVINYGTLTPITTGNDVTVSTVSTATTGYGPNSEENSPYNSNNADATSLQLQQIAVNNSYTLTGTNYLTIGDTNLYTARKDYIAATATRTTNPQLDVSNRGCEGAFKTVIVYRNPPTGDSGGGTFGTNRFVRLEATNTRNGAVTIAGFPMGYNNMSGVGSKYAYRNTAVTTRDDWIWISWEIVSNFWHVGMIVNYGTPNSAWTNDPWEAFRNDWYTHNFRKYGNWGLRIGG